MSDLNEIPELVQIGPKIPKLTIQKLKIPFKKDSETSLCNCINCYTEIEINHRDPESKSPGTGPERPKQYFEPIFGDDGDKEDLIFNPESEFQQQLNVSQVLEFIFKISSENENVDPEFLKINGKDESYLCWKCSSELRTLYKLFMGFMTSSQIPSVLAQVFESKVRNFRNSVLKNDNEDHLNFESEDVDDDEDYILPDLKKQAKSTAHRKDGNDGLKSRKARCIKMPKKYLTDSESDDELDMNTTKSRKSRLNEIAKKTSLTSISHVKNKRSNSNLLYDCPQCPAQFKHRSFVTQHVLSKHGSVRLTKRKSKERDSSKMLTVTFYCPVCRKPFETDELLHEHLTSKHIPRIRVKDQKCLECGKLFLSKNDMKSHFRSIHSNQNFQECDLCDFKTKRPQELKRHKKMKHLKEKNFHCSVCNNGYTLQWQLKLHEKIHLDDRTYVCTFKGCDKAFRAPSNLRQHEQMHKGAKYICHICGNSYSRKGYLTIHVNGSHLGLPIPPSQRRSVDPSTPKKSRLSKPKETEDEKEKKTRKDPNKELKQFRNPKLKHERKVFKEIDPEENLYFPEDKLGVLVGDSQDEVLILEEFVPEDHDKIEILDNSDLQLVTTVETTAQEDDGTDSNVDQIDGSKSPQELTLIDGQKILCYGNLQRIIDVQSVSSNHYYLATACSQNSENSDEVTNPDNTIGILPFSDFMSNLQ